MGVKRKYTACLACGIAFAALSLCAAACTDEPLGTDRGGTAATEATPVCFEITRTPLYAATRAVPQPRTWQAGDKIQIRAVFQGKEMSQPQEPQYGCYKFAENNGEGDWAPDTPGDRIYWPVGAETADFEAYYIEGLSGRISEDPGTSGTFLLGDINPGGDPLYAVKKELKYGRSVPLVFKHLCTHLEMQQVKTDFSGGYWLYCTGKKELPNAYELAYSKEKGFTFTFTTSDNCKTEEGDNGHYYIFRPRNAEGTVDFYLAKNNTEQTFFSPGGNLTDQYGNCKLTYRFNRSYLSFVNVESLNTLEAGKHYGFSVEKQLGIVPEPETDFPDKPQTDLGEVDIPELLDGIRNNKDVKDKNGNIVLQSGAPYPRLVRDVDFKEFKPLDYIEGKGAYQGNLHEGWKLPTLTVPFDGNFHSFINVAFPIFGDIKNGKIYNLAIRNSKIDILVADIKRMEEDKVINTQGVDIVTDLGLLACQMDGYYSNILIEDVEMTVHITDALSKNVQNRTYRIGYLAGNQIASASEASKIENVRLRGDVKLTVTTDEGEMNSMQECYAGIIAGQSGAVIDGISRDKAGKCTVSADPLKCKSAVYVGGIVGRSVNGMRNISVGDVTVNGSKIDAQRAYIGGLCGELANEKEEYGRMEDCTANVEVKGGVVRLVNSTVHARSYTGGIAGTVNSVTCRDINVTGSVTGGYETDAKTDNTQMIVYATGGGFGYVAGTITDIGNCTAWMTVQAAKLATASPWGNCTGTFAGLSTFPADALQADGKNNTAKENSSLSFVGKESPEPGGEVLIE